LTDLPAKTVPPATRGGSGDSDDFPSGTFGVRPHTVALLIADAGVRAEVHAILQAAGHALVGAELVSSAQVVLADADGDVGETLGQLREHMRSDGAVLVILRNATPDAVVLAHRAGAFACVRLPILAEELVSLVASALDTRTAKLQVADLSRQLDLQSHLASIGRISAGLSHELGNPLAVISMNVEMVRGECERLVDLESALREARNSPLSQREARIHGAIDSLDQSPTSGDMFEALDDARASLERMRGLLETMKELVGRTPRTMQSIDLAAVVKDARRFLPAELVAGVQIEEAIESVEAIANGTLVGQILVNLVTNAVHAARSLPAPRIRIHVYAAGDEAILSVRDNGPGIEPRVQEKIFEPFFTTRRTQGGLGLGLSLCREYALQMGARLSLWSAPGRGACFRLNLRRR
jgi:signal transduction histidine kinase